MADSPSERPGSATGLKVSRLRIRPSNLVLLAALPFAVYLFATVDKYTRALVFILGVEENAGAIFAAFLVLALALVAGLSGPWVLIKQPQRLLWRRAAMAAVVAHAGLLLVAAFGLDLTAFWNSVASNVVEARTSPLAITGARRFTLTPEAQELLTGRLRFVVIAYLAVWAVTGWLMLARGGSAGRRVWARRGYWAVTLGVNGFALAYLLLFAHLGFASGLFVTVRAAIIAYVAAAILGLGLAGLMGLKLKPKTYRSSGIVLILLVAVSAVLFTRPSETLVLVGTLDGRVAIVAGTPQRLTDRIRFGDYEGARRDDVAIRSTASLATGLELLANNETVTAVFVPADAAPPGLPVLWEVSFLPDAVRTPAILAAALAVFLAVLIAGAWQSGLHPLAIFAEFYVDLVRGVPMLVIILYIGLPLSGAIKDGTGGFIDLPNMTRGMVAIAIGYSAFMAEIFRAGIEAIPRGQIEAAHSVGLSRWQTARLVILPQAIRIVIPPLGNEFIAMLKDTSLLSILSVRDLTQRTREFQSSSFLPFAPFNTAAVVYVVLTLAASSLLKYAERRTERRPS